MFGKKYYQNIDLIVFIYVQPLFEHSMCSIGTEIQLLLSSKLLKSSLHFSHFKCREGNITCGLEAHVISLRLDYNPQEQHCQGNPSTNQEDVAHEQLPYPEAQLNCVFIDTKPQPSITD